VCMQTPAAAPCDHLAAWCAGQQLLHGLSVVVVPWAPRRALCAGGCFRRTDVQGAVCRTPCELVGVLHSLYHHSYLPAAPLRMHGGCVLPARVGPAALYQMT
jgi:hypothetical protein